MILAALLETRSTYRVRLYPRRTTISVYITPRRGSTPELPPVVSSIRLPTVLSFSVQHSSSVAMQWIAPRVVLFRFE